MKRHFAVRDLRFFERARMAVIIILLRSGAIAAKFGMTLFIAHFLDLETLGLYGFLTGAAVVVPILTGQGVLGILGRNSVDQDLASVIRSFAPYWTFLGVVYLTIVMVLLPWVYLYGYFGLALLVGLLVFVEHLNSDLLVVLNHRQKPELANFLLLIRTAAWIGCYMAAAYFTPALRNLPALLTFWLAGAGLAFLCFVGICREWPWRAALTSFSSWRGLGGLINRSRILYLNEITNTGSQYLDRYLVGAMLGLELAGVYFLFWSFANALSNIISTSLLQVQQPAILMARSHPEKQGRLLGALRLEAAVACAMLGAITALVAYLCLAYYPRPDFSSQRLVLPVLIVGFVLRMAYEVEGIGLYTRHEDRNTLLSALMVLLLSVSITIMLAPILGLIGPALAVVVSYAAGGAWRFGRNKSAYFGASIPPSVERG